MFPSSIYSKATIESVPAELVPYTASFITLAEELRFDYDEDKCEKAVRDLTLVVPLAYLCSVQRFCWQLLIYYRSKKCAGIVCEILGIPEEVDIPINVTLRREAIEYARVSQTISVSIEDLEIAPDGTIVLARDFNLASIDVANGERKGRWTSPTTPILEDEKATRLVSLNPSEIKWRDRLDT